MAINREEYPIDYNEAIDCVKNLKKWLIVRSAVELSTDPRPEILDWVIKKLILAKENKL